MKTASLAIVCSIVLVSTFRLQAQSSPIPAWGFDPDRLPLEVNDGVIAAALEEDDLAWIWGFSGRDFSAHDFSRMTPAFLLRQAFDSRTTFPEADRLPAGFDPGAILEACKNPGLGVRRLHEGGITGKGVSVAIIDKPMLSTHREFGSRLAYHLVYPQHPGSFTFHFHGIACASILAASSAGVAPAATIHYFCVPDNGQNYRNYLEAIEHLIELNRALAPAEKIRIVSISDGGREFSSREWKSAVKNLEKEGIAIVYSGGGVLNGFGWGGCPPFLDREDPSQYRASLYFKEGSAPRKIILPSDYRTTASNAGEGEYAYWGVGGWSWAIPYMAGLAALAWQIDPGLTYGEIEGGLRKTAIVNARKERVLNPPAYFEKLLKKQP